jgi:hypothetical protein
MTSPQPSEWVQAQAQVQKLGDSDVLKLLRQSLKDLNKMLKVLESRPTFSEAVRREQLQVVKRELLRQQSQILRQTGRIAQARRIEAAERSTRLGWRMDQELFAAAGLPSRYADQLLASLQEGLKRTVDVAVSRMTGASVPLSERVYRVEVWLNDRVGNMVNSALARGLSAREFAGEARDWINPNTPGGVRYASMRLARTEINNAFHSISVHQAQEKPWIDQMKWNLSRSHPKPDICDSLVGLYPKLQVPRKPHPQCFCYVTPQVEDRDAFLDNLLAGRYDDYLSQRIPSRDRQSVNVSSGGAPTATLTRPAAPRRVKESGRDMMDSVIDRAREFDRKSWEAYDAGRDLPESPFGDFGGIFENSTLAKLANMQGFDKTPISVSAQDFQRALDSGGVHIHRGVSGGKSSAKDISHQFLSGTYQPGKGLYGNGFYFSKDPSVAEFFAGKAKNRDVIDVALSPDARVIDYDDLIAMMKRDKSRIGEVNTAEGGTAAALLGEPSHYAVVRGYDAIRVRGYDDGSPRRKGEKGYGGKGLKPRPEAADQYVILNRSAVLKRRDS